MKNTQCSLQAFTWQICIFHIAFYLGTLRFLTQAHTHVTCNILMFHWEYIHCYIMYEPKSSYIRRVRCDKNSEGIVSCVWVDSYILLYIILHVVLMFCVHFIFIYHTDLIVCEYMCLKFVASVISKWSEMFVIVWTCVFVQVSAICNQKTWLCRSQVSSFNTNVARFACGQLLGLKGSERRIWGHDQHEMDSLAWLIFHLWSSFCFFCWYFLYWCWIVVAALSAEDLVCPLLEEESKKHAR